MREWDGKNGVGGVPWGGEDGGVDGSRALSGNLISFSLILLLGKTSANYVKYHFWMTQLFFFETIHTSHHSSSNIKYVFFIFLHDIYRVL